VQFLDLQPRDVDYILCFCFLDLLVVVVQVIYLQVYCHEAVVVRKAPLRGAGGEAGTAECVLEGCGVVSHVGKCGETYKGSTTQIHEY